MGAESSRKRLLFSVLVVFERRASNGVKRAFYRAGVKKKRQQTELVQNAAYWGLGDALRTVGKNRRKSCNIKKNPILNGGVGAWAQAGCSDENDEKSRNN